MARAARRWSGYALWLLCATSAPAQDKLPAPAGAPSASLPTMNQADSSPPTPTRDTLPALTGSDQPGALSASLPTMNQADPSPPTPTRDTPPALTGSASSASLPVAERSDLAPVIGAATAAADAPEPLPIIPPRDVCPHCNPEEQLLIDLNYYQQLLAIIGEINRQQSAIDPVLLQALNRMLMELRPGLAKMLQPPRPAPPAAQPKPVSKARAVPEAGGKPAGKPRKSRLAPRKRGIEGILVGHVQEANAEWGTPAVVALVINGRPRSLNVGSVFRHNRRSWKIIKTAYRNDIQPGGYHEVHLRDETSGKIHILPWQ